MPRQPPSQRPLSPRLAPIPLALLAALALALAAASASAAGPTSSVVVAQVNRVRAQHHLAAVRADAGLAHGARSHSVSMAHHYYFAHDSYDGSPWFQRVVRSAGTPNVGEVLGWLTGVARAREAVTVVRAWLRSPEHRVVLLAPRYRRIGVGRAWVVRRGHRTAIYTADFATG